MEHGRQTEMDNTTEALKLALELKNSASGYWTEKEISIIEKLIDALAQPEPVCDKDPQGCWNVRCQLGKKCKNTPPQRTWVNLPDEEIKILWIQYRAALPRYLCFARALLAKLKEKNT